MAIKQMEGLKERAESAEARLQTLEAENARLRKALTAVKDWLMTDPDNDKMLDDSVCWRDDFRKALNLTRAALTPKEDRP